MSEPEQIRAQLSHLEDPLAFLEGLFTYAPVGLQIYDAQGHCLLVNQAFLQLFGSAPPPKYNVLRDEIAAAQGVLELAHRAFAGETVHVPPIWYDPRELRQVQVAEGRRVAIETTAFPLFDREGQVRYVVFVFEEVTAQMEAQAERVRQAEALERDLAERRQAEAQLRETAEQLLYLSDHLEAVFWSLDPIQQKTLQISPACEKLYGVPRQAFFADPMLWRKFIHPEDVKIVDAHQPAVFTGQPVTHEYRIIRPDGQLRWVEVRVKPTLGSAGQLVRLDGTLLDITERKQAEEGVKLSLALQRVRNEILQMTSAEDWGRVVRVVFEQLSGLLNFHGCCINLVDLQKGTCAVYYPEADEADKIGVYAELPLLRPLEQAVKTGRYVYRRNQAERVEYGESPELSGEDIPSVVDVPFDGGTLAVNSKKEAAFDERDFGILEQFAQVLSEAHRRLEDLQNLAFTQRQLHQSQKLEAVGQLAGGIAHDFNNLITIISGYSEMMVRRLGAEHPHHAGLREIQKAADRGAALVRQVLAFSRKQVLEPKVLDLNTVVKDLEKMLHRLIGEDIELATQLTPVLGQVKADPGQIEQVLMNLIVNARDAMPQGGRLLIETSNAELDDAYVYRHREVAPGPYVMLAVSDTGIGMDAATQARIFEPFFTTKAPGEGTGLGLATVYGIIKQSGGYIWVYSEPGQGTTFKIYLPRLDGAVAPGGSEAVLQVPRGSETVLVVEDEEALRQLAGFILREMGYTVLATSRGEEALQLIAQHQGPLHLVITDMVMPEMGGRTLAEHLTALHPRLKVLYMSGYSAEIIERQGALEAGAIFLQKPFSVSALLLKVREALDK